MIAGCIFTDVVAWFIIVACAATLYVHGYHDIRDAADAAQALRPLAGDYAYILFALGLVQRFAVRRFHPAAFDRLYRLRRTGVRVRRGEEVREAPVFYWLYTVLIVAGAARDSDSRPAAGEDLVLSQVVNGVVLPFVLIFMLLLMNKKELMGEYVNTPTVQHRRLDDDRDHDRFDCIAGVWDPARSA